MKYFLKIAATSLTSLLLSAALLLSATPALAVLRAPSSSASTKPPLQPLPAGNAPNIQNNANYTPTQLPNAATPSSQDSASSPFQNIFKAPDQSNKPDLSRVQPITPENHANSLFLTFVVIVVLAVVAVIWYRMRKRPTDLE